MKKRCIRALITTLVVSSLIVTPVLAKPSIKDLKEDKKKAEKQVDALQNQLNDIIGKIDKLETQLIEKGEEVEKATEDLEVAKELERQQYEDMKLRIKYMYEEGDSSTVEVLTTATDFSDLVNKAEYVQNVHDYDRNKLNEYIETKEKVKKLKKKLEKEQKKLEDSQKEYEKKERELDNLIESKQKEVKDLDVKIEKAVEEAARKAEEERRAREAAAAAAAAQQAGTSLPTETDENGVEHVVAPGNTKTAKTIVAAAYTQLGVPYRWGGTTPGKGLDCSGLVQYCHRQAGISIGRTSGVQGSHGQRVTNPQPGDVVCYAGHVGLYIGGGQMIHAPHTGTVVKVAPVYGHPWYRRYW